MRNGFPGFTTVYLNNAKPTTNPSHREDDPIELRLSAEIASSQIREPDSLNIRCRCISAEAQGQNH
jgi:hypothetical protein